MSTLGVVLSVIFAIVSVLLTIIVILQGGRQAGLGAVGGGNDSYWSKNKSSSLEGTLSRYTKILGALFMVLALAINFIR